MAEELSSAFFTDLEDLKKTLEDGTDDHQLLDLSQLKKNEAKEEWFSEDYEGQLGVDVYQTKDNIIVKSTIAGVEIEELEIYLHNELLTIRGNRHEDSEARQADYLYKECYWGGFSRSIILPTEVQADKVKATLKNGILKIVLPKSQKSRLINVEIAQE